VSGDYQCSANTTQKVQANLNSCMENFNCDSGDCIPMAQRCNGVNDCEDSSDEFNCKVGNLILKGLSHDIDLSVKDMYGYGINSEKYTFCVIKSFEQLKNLKTGRVPYLGLDHTCHQKPNPSRERVP
jgi:hypothetical protein